MTIVVRDARPDELDAAAAILVAAFEQYRPMFGDHFEYYRNNLAEVRAPGTDLFVALDGERIAGAAMLCRPGIGHEAGPNGVPWPRAWASLRRLGVQPGDRGRGIGRLLVDARIRRARELGAPVIGLHTLKAFEIAHGMFRRDWKRAPGYDFRPVPEFCAEAYTLALA